MRDPLFRAIESHWREHRPRMVQRLEAQGVLSKAVEYAANRTADVESSLIRNGMSPLQAQDLMRQEWAFLPSEADVPELPNGGPEAWLRRQTSASAPTSTQQPGPVQLRHLEDASRDLEIDAADVQGVGLQSIVK